MPTKIDFIVPFSVKPINDIPIRSLSKLAGSMITAEVKNAQFNMVNQRLVIPQYLQTEFYPPYDQLQENYTDKNLVSKLIEEIMQILTNLRTLLEIRKENVINHNRDIIASYYRARGSITGRDPLSFVIEKPNKIEIMPVTANIPAIEQVVLDSDRIKTDSPTISIHKSRHVKNTKYRRRNDKRFEQVITVPINNNIDIENLPELLDSNHDDVIDNNDEKKRKRIDKHDYIVPKLIIPCLLSIPKSIAHVTSNRNLRTDDAPNLRFIPYFGDQDTTGIDIEAYDYIPGGTDFDVSGEAEEETVYYILTKHGYNVDDDKFPENVDEEDVYAQNAKKEVLIALSRVLRISKKNIVASFKKVSQGKRDEELSNSTMIDEINASRIQRLGSSVMLPLDGPAPPSYLNREKYNNDVGLRDVADYADLIDSYKDYFCRRCYIYYCTLHGIQQPQPRERKDPPTPPLCPVPDLSLPSDFIRRQPTDVVNNSSSNNNINSNSNNKVTHKSDTKADDNETNWIDSVIPRILTSTMKTQGSNTKSQRNDTNQDNLPSNTNIDEQSGRSWLDKIPYNLYANARGGDFKEFEKCLILKLNSMLKENGAKFEIIAKLLGTRTDQEVEGFLKDVQIDDVQPVLCQPVTAKKKGKFKKRKNRSVGYKSATKVLEYEPCNHEGPCDNNCPCVFNDGNYGGFCEKYCACSSDCKSRFFGCNCKSSCSTNACPCFKAHRECDPDLCYECGACIHPMYLPIVEEHLKKHKAIYDVAVQSHEFSIPPRNDDYIAQFERSKKISEYKLCTNVNITRKINDTKISMGRSSIHGWGAFLKTNVEKNEFIMEYNGEIISQSEAERRGRIYDKLDSSYLFNLNDDMAIDATRIGNKTKFINHDPNPNCGPKVILVKGEHKVAFYAKERLQAGQELTFNYGYTAEAAPQWTNTKRNSFLNG